ncbi:MAG TPA: SRPBCC family protein [Candidatus Binatia bacterium]|nr:SRPBCC family protein [Candidatus Binatia bacterium]
MASTSSIVETIDIAVPVRTAYNQWTQFEEFPQFMQGVEFVKQLDDANLHWCAEIGGKHKEWKAKITEQIPDKRIAWTSTEGAHNAGVVTFHRLSDDTCRVTLQLEYQPEGALEAVGDAIGLMTWNTRENLERFKEFIESRGEETGAYRGEIQTPEDRREGRSHAAQASQSTGQGSRMPGQTGTTSRQQQQQSGTMGRQQQAGMMGRQQQPSRSMSSQQQSGSMSSQQSGSMSRQQQQSGSAGSAQQSGSMGSAPQQPGSTFRQQQGGIGKTGTSPEKSGTDIAGSGTTGTLGSRNRQRQ